MVGGQAQEARRLCDHGQLESRGKPRQSLRLARQPADAGGDDQGPLRLRNPARQAVDVRRIGMRGRRRHPRRDVRLARNRRRHGCRQGLARQRQVDGAAGACQRRLQRPGYDEVRLLRAPQLVVPFHQLAHHARLVEHLLRPVDRPVARAEGALLQDRRAACHQQQRDAVAAGIGQHVDGVGSAHVDMHHHRLRCAGYEVGAVRHGHGEVLVRRQHGARHLRPALPGACQALDNGREIGAGVDEEIRNPVASQRGQEHVAGGGRHRCRLALRLAFTGHSLSPLGTAVLTFLAPKAARGAESVSSRSPREPALLCRATVRRPRAPT